MPTRRPRIRRAVPLLLLLAGLIAAVVGLALRRRRPEGAATVPAGGRTAEAHPLAGAPGRNGAALPPGSTAPTGTVPAPLAGAVPPAVAPEPAAGTPPVAPPPAAAPAPVAADAPPAAPAAPPAAPKSPASAVNFLFAPATELPQTAADGPFGPGSALPLPDGSAPGPEFTIKGNATSKLFHTPSSPYFGRTKAEAWFRTAEEAEAAGFTRWTPRPRPRGADQDPAGS